MSKCIGSKRIIHGLCLVDVYRAPGDLYDSWDIVPKNPDGSFSRKPNAGYGPDARDRDVEEMEFAPVFVVEEYKRWDVNGWTQGETVIRANGKIIASRQD